MSVREELGAALDAVRGARTFNLTDGRKGRAIVSAARERLVELPPYSDELVERIARAITNGTLLGDSWERHAVRVLDALNRVSDGE